MHTATITATPKGILRAGISILSLVVVCLTEPSPPINAIIVGGSSGMGKAVAKSVVSRGGKVLIASRSIEKLKQAACEIRSHAPATNDDAANEDVVEIAVLDASDENAVKDFSERLTQDENGVAAPYHGLVVSCAGRAPHGPIHALETYRTGDLFRTKYWSAYYCAKYLSSRLQEGGSIAFVSGVLNRRPGVNCVPLASTNGALEGLTRALALDLGPSLRVNCLSPGFCDTERFDHMSTEKREAMLENTAESLPLKRVGQPYDMGEALYYLLTAKFVTGVVLDCDGGHGIRQYANIASDPMRKGT